MSVLLSEAEAEFDECMRCLAILLQEQPCNVGEVRKQLVLICQLANKMCFLIGLMRGNDDTEIENAFSRFDAYRSLLTQAEKCGELTSDDREEPKFYEERRLLQIKQLRAQLKERQTWRAKFLAHIERELSNR